MKGPWRHGRTRLGVKFGGKASNAELAIGWTLIRLGPDPAAIFDEGAQSGDPFERAMAKAREAIANGAQGVDLYGYLDGGAYAKFAHRHRGMSRGQHCLLLARVARALRAEEIDVVVHWLDEGGITSPGAGPQFDDFPPALLRKP